MNEDKYNRRKITYHSNSHLRKVKSTRGKKLYPYFYKTYQNLKLEKQKLKQKRRKWST